jgi:uncharacterized oxidoreductase
MTKLQQQTVLITGGSSGIGLELAKQLIEKQNAVIVCGRSEGKLAETRAILPNVETIACDVSVPSERIRLKEWIVEHYPECNILINNAAVVHKTDFYRDDDIMEKADLEIRTNLMAPMALTKLFLPIFTKRTSVVINITTGLVYAPRAVYPVYNATKAALHSFTQVLRQQIKGFPVEVIEVMMPVVATPWHKGEIPKIAITPERAVREMITGIENGKQEIRVAGVRILYALSRISPGLAFRMINRVK